MSFLDKARGKLQGAVPRFEHSRNDSLNPGGAMALDLGAATMPVLAAESSIIAEAAPSAQATDFPMAECVRTDSPGGTYTLSGLRAGAYVVMVSKNGPSTPSEAARVAACWCARAAIAVRPSGPW